MKAIWMLVVIAVAGCGGMEESPLVGVWSVEIEVRPVGGDPTAPEPLPWAVYDTSTAIMTAGDHLRIAGLCPFPGVVFDTSGLLDSPYWVGSTVCGAVTTVPGCDVQTFVATSLVTESVDEKWLHMTLGGAVVGCGKETPALARAFGVRQ